MTRLFLAFSLMITLLAGCVSSPFYQKSVVIPGNSWGMDFRPDFVFDVEDTTIHYNLSFIIRHTNNYSYSNIWMNVLVKRPGETSFTRTRIEIPLATAQGQWLGNGMGEIFEQRRMMVLDHRAIPVTNDLVSLSENSINDLFSKKGRYEIRLEQNMREKSLSDILHVGLRVEKSSAKKTVTPKEKSIS